MIWADDLPESVVQSLHSSSGVFLFHLFIHLERVNTMLTFKDNRGQGLVEYALILALVAIVVIVILVLLGPAIANVFSSIMTLL